VLWGLGWGPDRESSLKHGRKRTVIEGATHTLQPQDKLDTQLGLTTQSNKKHLIYTNQGGKIRPAYQQQKSLWIT
jgi:hypothetical protein